MIFSLFCLFFFFKQKTAYEMRISDWSSDVCSSDLTQGPRATMSAWRAHRAFPGSRRLEAAATTIIWARSPAHCLGASFNRRKRRQPSGFRQPSPFIKGACPRPKCGALPPLKARRSSRPYRSEEHTSELQSLMRISYAVFCLKTKKNTTKHNHNNNCHQTYA